MHDNSRRWALRQRTAAAHTAVDEAIGGFGTIESYKAYLRSIAAFRRPLEAALERANWPDALGDWRPRRVGAAIAADLDDLGVRAGERESDGLAAPVSGDRLFGTAYVLEGSALGARLLFERAQALGLSATFGARHLALQSGSIDSWRTFLARLEDADPFDFDGALEGSLWAFDHARQAFAGVRD